MHNTSSQPLDVVIPFHNKDSDILKYCITSCKKYIPGLHTIHLVVNSPVSKMPGVSIIHEKDYFPQELTVEYIRKRWEKEFPANAYRAGWLFQQFIKRSSCYAIPGLTDDYLLLDADVIWLKPASFFENNKLLISPSSEYHHPYYQCFSSLLGNMPQSQHSFISHHFPMNKKTLQNLLDTIEQRWNKVWYESILDHMDYSQAACFSEYEMMGLYLKSVIPDAFLLRPLKNIQSFRWRYLFLILCGLADYVTIHDYKKPDKNPNTSRVIYSLYLKAICYRLGIKNTVHSKDKWKT